MEKVQYMYGLMAMEGNMTIVQLMGTLEPFIVYLLELLVLMVIPVGLMKIALQKWLPLM